MSRFLQRHKAILAQDFIVFTIERRQAGAADPVVSRIRAGKEGGIPWSAVLDAQGAVLVTSNDASGKNLGFPFKPAAIELFIEMIAKTSHRINRNQLQIMENSLMQQTILFEVLDERRKRD
jgi:hypothetical protein